MFGQSKQLVCIYVNSDYESSSHAFIRVNIIHVILHICKYINKLRFKYKCFKSSTCYIAIQDK